MISLSKSPVKVGVSSDADVHGSGTSWGSPPLSGVAGGTQVPFVARNLVLGRRNLTYFWRSSFTRHLDLRSTLFHNVRSNATRRNLWQHLQKMVPWKYIYTSVPKATIKSLIEQKTTKNWFNSEKNIKPMYFSKQCVT